MGCRATRSRTLADPAGPAIAVAFFAAVAGTGAGCSKSRASGAAGDAGAGGGAATRGATGGASGGTTATGGASGRGGTPGAAGSAAGTTGAGGAAGSAAGTTGAGGAAGTTGAGGATGAGSATGGSAGASAADDCPSATSNTPGTLILAGISPDGTVIGMRGDGSVKALWHGPGWPGQDVSVQSGLLLADASPPGDSVDSAYKAVLIDRAGATRWGFSHALDLANNTYRTGVFVGADGSAAIAFSTTGQVEYTAAIQPTGASRVLDGLRAESAPDAAGWMVYSKANVNGGDRTWGFANATDGSVIAARMPMIAVSIAPPAPLVIGGRLFYKSTMDYQQFGVAVEGPAGARFVPVPLPDGASNTFTLQATDAGVLLVDGGTPRWLLRDSGELLPITPPAGAVGGTLRTSVGGGWALVVGDDWTPRWSVRLDTATVALVDAVGDPPGPTQSGAELPLSPASHVSGHWGMGVTATGHIWRADLASGRAEYVDPWPALAMRTFGCNKEQPALAPDGTIMIALRDDSLAGFYAAAPGAPFSLVGQPYTQVGDVSGRRLGDTFVVVAVPRPTYCSTTSATWAAPPAGAPAPLRGAAGQVVFAGITISPIDSYISPGSGPFPPSAFLLMPSSGACGISPYTARNFATGEQFDFMANPEVSRWW